MVRDDHVRTTLRLPLRLYAKVLDAAKADGDSLNNEIISLLYEALDARPETSLTSLPSSEWLHELKRMRAANEKRYEELERIVLQVLAEHSAQKKKGRAA